MRVNVAEEEDDNYSFVANVTSSLNISEIGATARGPDSSTRLEIYDSGASCHMSPYIDAFVDFTFIEPKAISVADNTCLRPLAKE